MCRQVRALYKVIMLAQSMPVVPFALLLTLGEHRGRLAATCKLRAVLFQGLSMF